MTLRIAEIANGSPRRRVVIIGAGPAGLATLKELLDKGHDAIAVEAKPMIGGVYTDTYGDLQLTSSSALTSYSSFVGGDPARPVLWRSEEYLAYLRSYAERFDLMRHVRLNTAVRSVRRGPDGGWLVRVTPAANGGAGAPARDEELTCDHVAVCCGGNRRPQVPAWLEGSKFDGRICHSAAIRGEHEFRGRRVLVVGLGESGSDLTLMAARVGEACAISTREGPGYVIPRTYRGLPSDLDTSRCYHSLPRAVCGHPIVRFKVRIEDALLTDADDPAVLRKAGEINNARGVAPHNRFGCKSTGFVEAMVYHGATYHPAVERLERDHVVFVDGTTFKCDLIVCCTGFRPEFAFLNEYEPELAARAGNARGMYKHMILPDVGTGIVWIGFVRPAIGGVPPCAEMQARYFAQLISGERVLPPQAEMARDTQMHADLDLRQFPHDAKRLLTLTDFLRFMETMADVIGCRPPIARLLMRRPRVAWKVMFGPLCCAQYRLAGPGADEENASKALRVMPTMPLPVLLYTLLLLGGCWVAGLTAEPWRTTRVQSVVEPPPDEARPPGIERPRGGWRFPPRLRSKAKTLNG
jgi:dimethylaniline monooxygenase (N-oxide forming)